MYAGLAGQVTNYTVPTPCTSNLKPLDNKSHIQKNEGLDTWDFCLTVSISLFYTNHTLISQELFFLLQAQSTSSGGMNPFHIRSELEHLGRGQSHIDLSSHWEWSGMGT